jgi:sugar lactone lactonase YvrE
MDPKTGAHHTVATGGGLLDPDGLDFAANGSLYVADYGAGGSGSGGVFRVNPKTGVVAEVALNAPLVQPLDLSVGPDRQIYVGDFDAHVIFNLSPGGGITPLPGSSLFGDGPLGIDQNAAGTIYAVDQSAGPGNGFGVIRVDPRTGAEKLVASGPPGSGSYGFALAPNGKTAYVGDDVLQRIDRVNVKTGAVAQLNISGAPVDSPTGLALAPSGTLYVANNGGDNVLSVNTRTGLAKEVGTLAPSGFPEGIAIEPPRCGGKLATVVGTTGKDKLKGSRFGDVVATLGGHDVVRGLAGKDIICGGGGPDKLVGGKGKDRLLGGKGRDVCIGGPGRDRELSC